MIRINLLPPEIIQKRKDEQRWRWVVLGAVLVFVVLLGVFLLVQIQVSMKADEVAQTRQRAAEKTAEASRFQIFQVKEADLTTRRGIARQALAGRMDWARIYSDVALMLPSDIYLSRMNSTEAKIGGAVTTPGKITMDGKAIDFPNDVPDLGYKSVAKLLVRLAELEELESVWMSSSSKTPAPAQATTETPYINFNVSANISLPPTGTASAPNP